MWHMGKVGVKLAVFFVLIGDAASTIATAATITQCKVQLSIPEQALSGSAGQTITLKGWGPNTAQAQDHVEQVAFRIAWHEILLRTWREIQSPGIRTGTALMMRPGSEHGVPGYRIRESGCREVVLSARRSTPGWQALWEDGVPESIVRGSLPAALAASRRRACQAEFERDTRDVFGAWGDTAHDNQTDVLGNALDLFVDNLLGCYTQGERQLGRVKGPTPDVMGSTYECTLGLVEGPHNTFEGHGTLGGRAWGPGLDWTAELLAGDALLNRVRKGLSEMMVASAEYVPVGAAGFDHAILNRGAQSTDIKERAGTQCKKLASGAQALRFSYNALPDKKHKITIRDEQRWWERSASEGLGPHVLTCSPLEEGASWARQKRKACGEVFTNIQQMVPVGDMLIDGTWLVVTEGIRSRVLGLALMGQVGCDAGLIPSASIADCSDLARLLKTESKEDRDSILSKIIGQPIASVDQAAQEAALRRYTNQNAISADAVPVDLSSGDWGVPDLVDRNPNRENAFDARPISRNWRRGGLQIHNFEEKFAALLLTEPPQASARPGSNPDAGEGAKAKREEGKVGKKDSKMERAKGSRVEIEQRDLQRELADNAGLMDQGGSGLGGGGSASGLGGTGTRGSGLGGIVVRYVSGELIILGSLDKSLIDRVIKQNMNEIKHCYQRESLFGTPKDEMYGKIVVKFVISGDGSVIQATTHSSTMTNFNNMRFKLRSSCINQRFLSFTFPEPRGGGHGIGKATFIFSPQ
jgi:hypothetical protein